MESTSRFWWKKLLESRWSAAAALVMITTAAYWPALHAGFIWSDADYLTTSHTLPDLSAWRHIWFKGGPVPLYYPVVRASFWLESQVWGVNPFGYHLTNVMLHALAAILVWRLLSRLQIPGAWVGAALFALHPVQVESVAWIAQRKTVLSAVFCLASALAYLRFRQVAGGSGLERTAKFFYSWALLLFIVALLSERVAAFLPAALLLIYWWKEGRLRRSDFLPLAPFFFLAAATVLVTILIDRQQLRAEGMVLFLTYSKRFLLAGRAFWFYIGKLLWPTRLTFIYPFLELNVRQWWQWLFPIAAAALVTGLWYARRRIGRAPVVAVLLFAGALFPALGWLNAHPFAYSYRADHFQYLASIGLIAPVAAGLTRLPRITWLVLLAILGFLTVQRTQIYRDPQTLWRDTLAKNPGSWMSHNSLGNSLLESGQVNEAIAEYQEAIKGHPTLGWTYDNLGRAYLQQNRVDEAISCFRMACELRPNDEIMRYHLGNAFLLMGEPDNAILNYQKALEIKPDFPEPKMQLRKLGVPVLD